MKQEQAVEAAAECAALNPQLAGDVLAAMFPTAGTPRETSLTV